MAYLKVSIVSMSLYVDILVWIPISHISAEHIMSAPITGIAQRELALL